MIIRSFKIIVEKCFRAKYFFLRGQRMAFIPGFRAKVLFNPDSLLSFCPLTKKGYGYLLILSSVHILTILLKYVYKRFLIKGYYYILLETI